MVMRIQQQKKTNKSDNKCPIPATSKKNLVQIQYTNQNFTELSISTNFFLDFAYKKLMDLEKISFLSHFLPKSDQFSFYTTKYIL
jgi:hypothetical protein